MPRLVVCPIRLIEIRPGKFAWAPKVRAYSRDWTCHSEWDRQARTPADSWCICKVDAADPAMAQDSECVRLPADPDELLGVRASALNSQLSLLGVTNPDAAAGETSHDFITRLGRRRTARFSSRSL